MKFKALMKNKMTTSYFFLLTAFICIALMLSSCKKGDDEPVPYTPVSYLCTGKGSTSFYPMAINNEWSYPGGFNSSTLYFIRGTKEFGSYTYFKIGTNYGGESYYREDTNGDILTCDTTNGSETILIPGTPVVNYEWLYPDGSIKKITSINATVSTSGCEYLNCMKILYKDQNGNTTRLEYYKKGIGLVSYTTYPLPGTGSPVKFDLTSVILN